MTSKPYDIEHLVQDIDGITEWVRIPGDGAWAGIVEGWTESNKKKWVEHTKKFDCVIQAGGNCGVYPRLFAEIFKWVYTFEPHPWNFHCLVNNCQVDNIIKINGVLGDEHTVVGLESFGVHNPGATRIGGTGRIPMFKIDDLGLPECDLIQLDVEGTELKVLKGAVETIKKFVPTISCERGDQQGILEFLQPFGYQQVDKTFDDVIYKA